MNHEDGVSTEIGLSHSTPGGLPAATDDLAAASDVSLPKRRLSGPGRVVTLVSGKDGAGKSTLAANLAVAAAQSLGLATAIVDLDLQFGDQGMMFRLTTYPCLDDVVASSDALTLPFLIECMHQSQGVYVLTGPATPDRGDLLDVRHVTNILALLRGAFDCVILDVASHLGEVTLEAIEQADQLLLVTGPQLGAIKDSKRLLKVLSDLQVPGHRLTVALNRVSPVKMGRELVESNLRFPVSADLPASAERLLDAITDGVPLMASNPKSEYSRAVGELASGLLSQHVQASEASATARAPRRRLGLFSPGSGRPAAASAGR
jgi:pilus assembly protein CpaE